MMEQVGFLFFASFIDLVRQFVLPLAAVFIAYLLLELKRLRSDERVYAFLMFSYFFLMISTYWVIKPIKKALFVEYYKAVGGSIGGVSLNAAQMELLAKELNLVLAIFAAWGFAKLASFVKREKLALSLIAFFAAGFLVFTFLFNNAGALTRWAFYCYGDFFATLMVAGFFAFLNDSGDSFRARRLYGVIGLGGIVGGFFGSTLLAVYVKQLTPPHIAEISIGALGLMAVLIFLAGKHVSPLLSASPSEPPLAGQNGLMFVLKSPYLLGIAALVGLYEMVSTLMDYQFTAAVLRFVPGDQLGGHFANVFSFTNLMAIIIQLFFTRLILMRLGVPSALLFLPCVALMGEIGFVVLPGLLFGSLLNTFDNAMAYSLNQSAKEALYVPMDQEAKYRGKGFVDVFVVRGAKALSAVVALTVTIIVAEFKNIRWLSLMVIALLILWLLIIRYIRPRYEQLCSPSIKSP